MPDELRQFVNKRTREGRFSTPTEYVRQLLRDDQNRESERRLEQLLLEGLGSGNARGDLKALFRTLNRRVDEIEAARRAGDGNAARPKTRRRARSR